jgi:hypothetical protein
MSRFVLLVLIASAFFSCKKEIARDCTTDIYKYEFYTISEIDTGTTLQGLYFQVKPGSDLVFLYTHIGPSCKSIWDEEYTDNLVFKVPSAVNSFYYENSQLADVMCFFNNTHLFSNGAVAVTAGSVRGNKRVDGKWDLQINVDIPSSIGRLIINKTFVQN